MTDHFVRGRVSKIIYDLIFLKAACIIMHTSRCRCVTGYLEEKQLNFHHHDEHSEDKALT